MSKWLLSIIGKIFVLIKKHIRRCEYEYHSQRYKKSLKACDKGFVLSGISQIYGLEKIELGCNVHIADNAFINGLGGLTIGDNTHISRNMVLYTINHEYEGKCLPYDENFRYRPVEIGKNVWIGTNVTILPGTVIGEGAIIGAGAVVSGSVEPYCIYGAATATKIGERQKDRYQQLEEQGLYGGVNGRPLV